MIERNRLIKCKEYFREFVLRQLPTSNLASIEWILERKSTEDVDIKHDLILRRIHGWLVMASSLLGENLEVKRVVDKLFKETFTEMIMHSYYTSGLSFVTDIKRIYGEKIKDDFSRTSRNHPGEHGQETHVYHVGEHLVV